MDLVERITKRKAMMHFSRVLVPTDFSDASYAAFDAVAYDRKMEGTEICLLHVCQYFPARIEIAEGPTPPNDTERYEPLRWRAQEKLDELAKEYFHGQKMITQAILTRSSPGNCICDYARKHDSELIVIAARGHSRLRGLLFGGTVQRVLSHAPCPVMVIPAQRNKHAERPISETTKARHV